MLLYRQNGNAALNAQEIEEQKVVQEKKKKQLKSVAIPVKLKIKIMVSMILVSVMAVVMVSRFAAVSKANLALIEMQGNVSEQQDVVVELESELSKSVQLDSIKEQALALNMAAPTQEQIVYLEVTSYEDMVKSNSEKNDSENQGNIFTELVD